MGRLLALLLTVVVGVSAVSIATPAQATYSKATNHGQILCAKGQIFDPRGGGQCWTCPAGTHRTIFPVHKAKACERRASSSWKKASFKGKRKVAKPSGAFFDPRKGGEWWRCPKGYPRRTAYAVTDRRACATKRLFGEKLTKAQFVSKTTRAKPAGAFFDPRKGGEYWSCPRGYKRTVLAVTSAKACQRVTKASLTRAKFIKSVGCAKGQFFDPRKGGQCWSCPAKWHRTTRAVTSPQACTDSLANIIVDGTALCRAAVGSLAKGSQGIQSVKKFADKIVAPIRAPADRVLHALKKQFWSTRGTDEFMRKVGQGFSRHAGSFDQVAPLITQAQRNKHKIAKVLFNPTVMCSGNARKIVSALKAAGLNPKRRAGLLDGWLVSSAHAAANRLHVAVAATGYLMQDDNLGVTYSLTLVTDLVSNTRLYLSVGGIFATKWDTGVALDLVFFPRSSINDFDAVQNLGIALQFQPGATTNASMEKWGMRGKFLKRLLQGGVLFSLNPGALNRIPGIGTSLLSFNKHDNPGLTGPLDFTGSVDFTVQLVKFR